MEERVFELEEESKLVLKIKGKEYSIDTTASVKMAKWLSFVDKYTGGELQSGEFFGEAFKHLNELGIPKDTLKPLSANQHAKLLEFIYSSQKKS